MINVGELINDPDFAQTFERKQKTGRFQDCGDEAGEYRSTLNQSTLNGIIYPARSNDLSVLPEGQRSQQTIVGFVDRTMYMGDQDSENAQLSDFIYYKGATWKVINIQDYLEYGYVKFLAVQYNTYKDPAFVINSLDFTDINNGIFAALLDQSQVETGVGAGNGLLDFSFCDNGIYVSLLTPCQVLTGNQLDFSSNNNTIYSVLLSNFSQIVSSSTENTLNFGNQNNSGYVAVIDPI